MIRGLIFLACALSVFASPTCSTKPLTDAESNVTSLFQVRLSDRPQKVSARGSAASSLLGSVGILIGYSDPAEVLPGTFAAISLQLAHRWAAEQNYTLFLEPNLGRLSNDSSSAAPQWDKLRAMRNHLHKVDVLFWLDYDVFILDPRRSAEELLRVDPEHCRSTGQPEDDKLLAQKQDIFLWAASSEFVHLSEKLVKNGEPKFKLGLCSGMFALANDPRSFRLLDEAIHDAETTGDNWPYEQGSLWKVLLATPAMLKRTCVLSEKQFLYESMEQPHSIVSQPSFAVHATGLPASSYKDQLRLDIGKAVCAHVLGNCPPFQVSQILTNQQQSSRHGRDEASTFSARGGRPYTVMTIFGGRRDRFPILAGYLQKLRAQGSLDETHIWDYTMNVVDQTALQSEALKLGARVFSPRSFNGNITDGSKWSAYYKYYFSDYQPPADVSPANVVIVKCDDDIVFIDTHRFPEFVKATAGMDDTFIVHANIVNSPVTAFYQQARGALKGLALEYPATNGTPGSMGSLVTSPEKARALHLQYLERPKAFSWDGPCIEFHHPDTQRYTWQGRASINMFAVRFSQWSKVWHLVQEAHGDNHNAQSDEMLLTSEATNEDLKECIMPFFSVVHLSFSDQHSIDAEVLPWYRSLLERM